MGCVFFEDSEKAGRPTSLWSGEALMEVENHLVDEVLDVAVLRTADKHHPVMGEAFHRDFLPHLGTVTEFQLHLDGTLW